MITPQQVQDKASEHKTQIEQFIDKRLARGELTVFLPFCGWTPPDIAEVLGAYAQHWTLTDFGGGCWVFSPAQSA